VFRTRLLRRETLALAAVVLALAIAVPFAFSDSGGDVAPRAATTATGTGPEPTVEATSTPLPSRGALPAPGTWALTLWKDLGGRPRNADTVFAERLDLSFATTPFPDYADGAWGLQAEASWKDLVPGMYTLAVEYDCALVVRSGETELARMPDPASAQTLSLSVAHKGGELALRLEATDAPGPFTIRWR
jgi:hypothetical protein